MRGDEEEGEEEAAGDEMSDAGSGGGGGSILDAAFAGQGEKEEGNAIALAAGVVVGVPSAESGTKVEGVARHEAGDEQDQDRAGGGGEGAAAAAMAGVSARTPSLEGDEGVLGAAGQGATATQQALAVFSTARTVVSVMLEEAGSLNAAETGGGVREAWSSRTPPPSARLPRDEEV